MIVNQFIGVFIYIINYEHDKMFEMILSFIINFLTLN
jgi:hypothetical protein